MRFHVVIGMTPHRSVLDCCPGRLSEDRRTLRFLDLKLLLVRRLLGHKPVKIFLALVLNKGGDWLLHLLRQYLN